MDFEDTAEEAAFRTQVRAWIDANAPRHLEEELKRASFGSNGVVSEDPIAAGKASPNSSNSVPSHEFLS